MSGHNVIKVLLEHTDTMQSEFRGNKISKIIISNSSIVAMNLKADIECTAGLLQESNAIPFSVFFFQNNES